MRLPGSAELAPVTPAEVVFATVGSLGFGIWAGLMVLKLATWLPEEEVRVSEEWLSRHGQERWKR